MTQLRAASQAKADRVAQLARNLVADPAQFAAILGPGAGNRATNAFMKALRTMAHSTLGDDFSEQAVCGNNKLCVDFYFRDEATILEVALGLPNPNTEFEKDILKAIMAKESGHPVKRLLFVSRPGAMSKCSQAGRLAMIEWADVKHGISVEIKELPGAPRSRVRRP